MTVPDPPGFTRRLSALDTTFLELESVETPMHIGGAFILRGDPLRDADGRFRLDDARSHIEARLRHAPLFKKKLSTVPFRLGRSLWIDDPEFDIDRHVKLTAVPAPGDRQDLLDLCAMLHMDLLDRDHPLWEVWFVDGLADGSVAIIEKIHHSLIDGVSGVELAAALFDVAPVEGPDVPHRRPPVPGPNAVERVADAVLDQVADPLRLLRSTIQTIRDAPEILREDLKNVGAAAGELLQPAAIGPAAPFNRAVHRRRVLQTVTVGLEPILQARKAFGASINDVLLACVAGALRRWFVAEGEEPIEIHSLVPMSTRRGGMSAEPGNHLGVMFVALPVDEPNPIRRLELVMARMADLKAKHEGDATSTLLQAMDHIPAVGLRLVPGLIAVQPFANLIITNVPGPRDRLYFLGATVEEMIPLLPLAPGLGLAIAVMSYADVLTISLFADPDACAHVETLAEALTHEFEAAVGLTAG